MKSAHARMLILILAFAAVTGWHYVFTRQTAAPTAQPSPATERAPAPPAPDAPPQPDSGRSTADQPPDQPRN
jgi:hypothetical protein